MRQSDITIEEASGWAGAFMRNTFDVFHAFSRIWESVNEPLGNSILIWRKSEEDYSVAEMLGGDLAMAGRGLEPLLEQMQKRLGEPYYFRGNRDGEGEGSQISASDRREVTAAQDPVGMLIIPDEGIPAQAVVLFKADGRREGLLCVFGENTVIGLPDRLVEEKIKGIHEVYALPPKDLSVDSILDEQLKPFVVDVPKSINTAIGMADLEPEKRDVLSDVVNGSLRRATDATRKRLLQDLRNMDQHSRRALTLVTGLAVEYQLRWRGERKQMEERATELKGLGKVQKELENARKHEKQLQSLLDEERQRAVQTAKELKAHRKGTVDAASPAGQELNAALARLFS